MFKKLYEGSYDNDNHEIKLEPFEWINYALLRRYMTRKMRDKTLRTPPPPPSHSEVEQNADVVVVVALFVAPIAAQLVAPIVAPTVAKLKDSLQHSEKNQI